MGSALLRAMDAGEGGGSTVAVVAAVGHDPDMVAVAATAMVSGPAAFGVGVHHAGLGDVGCAVAGLDGGWEGGSEDEEGEQCFHGDAFQVYSFKIPAA